MPVQINEVVIRAVVTAEGNDAATAQSCAPGNTDGTGGSNGESEIAELILEIIQAKKER